MKKRRSAKNNIVGTPKTDEIDGIADRQQQVRVALFVSSRCAWRRAGSWVGGKT